MLAATVGGQSVAGDVDGDRRAAVDVGRLDGQRAGRAGAGGAGGAAEAAARAGHDLLVVEADGDRAADRAAGEADRSSAELVPIVVASMV